MMQKSSERIAVLSSKLTELELLLSKCCRWREESTVAVNVSMCLCVRGMRDETDSCLIGGLLNRGLNRMKYSCSCSIVFPVHFVAPLLAGCMYST